MYHDRGTRDAMVVIMKRNNAIPSVLVMRSIARELDARPTVVQGRPVAPVARTPMHDDDGFLTFEGYVRWLEARGADGVNLKGG